MWYRLFDKVGVEVDSTDEYFKPARENVLRYRREPYPIFLYLWVGIIVVSCIVTWFTISFEQGIFAYVIGLGASFWKALDDGGEYSKVMNEEMRRLRAEAKRSE